MSGKYQGIISAPEPPAGLAPGFQAIMVSHPADFNKMAKGCREKSARESRLLTSRLLIRNGPCVLLGPFLGAPHASALLEILIFWGVRSVVLFGWCGAVSTAPEIGDIIIPDSAFIDEGTSRCYQPEAPLIAWPDADVRASLSTLFAPVFGDRLHRGPVWTTDALFDESREKVFRYQAAGALAVEMETSALFTVAALRKTPLAAALVVSDTLSSGEWRPGFSDKRFAGSRKSIRQILIDYFETL
jgi:uridine phosphorylase